MLTVQEIINEIITKEGGYVDHADDLGGPTNYGITLATYRSLFPGATVDNLKLMTKHQAYSIYESKYYIKSGINLLSNVSDAVAAEVLDTAVNMGVKVAVTFLQTALNALNNKQKFYDDLLVDGSCGQKTVNALQKYKDVRGTSGEIVLLKALNCLQGARYIELALAREANESFVYGWLNQRVHI